MRRKASPPGGIGLRDAVCRVGPQAAPGSCLVWRVTHFDLAIIGTGSGNSLVTPDFDGKRVAIIESGTFGGTCINVGCIPTKMYVYAA